MAARHPKFGIAMASLAFFFFLFLESTLYYQTAILPFPSGRDFLFIQLPILVASSAGFLSFPVFVRKTDRTSRRILSVMFTAVGLACLAVEHLAYSAQTSFVAGFISFYLLGIAGGGALWAASVVLSRSTYLATWVGICHAAGVVAQIALFGLAPTRLVETVVLGVGIVAFVGFAMAAWPSMKSARRLAADKTLDYSYYDRKPFPFAGPSGTACANVTPLRFAVAFCVVVGLFAALFSLLYNALPGGATWVSQYTDVSSRIALIVGGLAAGILIDTGRVRHTGTVMLCVAFLATAATLAGKAGIDEWICRLAFFGGSGMFAIFYSASSIWVAPYMKVPQLWASMGRAVSNLTTIAVWLPAAALADSDDATMLALAAISLFAAATLLMNAARSMISDDVGPNRRLAAEVVTEGEWTNRAGGSPLGHDGGAGDSPLVRDDSDKGFASQEGSIAREDSGESASEPGFADGNPPTPAALSPEAQLERFARTYGLTPRETTVLAAVTQDERPLKQVAADLDVTLRTVQRHLTSVYQKTSTQTRAGLAVRFFNATKESSQEDPPPEAVSNRLAGATEPGARRALGRKSAHSRRWQTNARAPRGRKAACPHRKRPDLRSHRAEVELRPPADGPLQPRDREALGRGPARLRPDSRWATLRTPRRAAAFCATAAPLCPS